MLSDAAWRARLSAPCLTSLRGRTENEPTFSVQLATRLQDCLNDLLIEGHRIQVSIRTVQDRGRGAAERRYGTDLVVIVRIDTDEVSVAKGLLVQAKNEGSEGVHVEGARRQRVEVTTPSRQLLASAARCSGSPPPATSGSMAPVECGQRPLSLLRPRSQGERASVSQAPGWQTTLTT